MANLKRHEADARREYMKALIRAAPKTSGDKLNDLFSKKHGSKMRINTIFDLKQELGYDRNGNLVKPEKNAIQPSPTRRRDPQEVVAGAPFPLFVKIEGEDPPALVKKVVDALRGVGILENVEVARGPGYVVLQLAT